MTVNDTHYCACPAPRKGSPKNESGTKAALLEGAKWGPGETITIRFLDGSPALQERVKKHAREWTNLAGLNFSFVDSAPSDIRISFTPGGSWSYLGTQCRDIPEPQPTMNYGWFTDDTAEAEIRRVVLHEFGHALGLIHEHQNPREPIEWNRAAVIADLSKPPNGWDEATIENNMFAKYKDVVATAVDVDSIMMYPIPAAWLIRGRPAGFNTELSDTDRQFIAEAYPKM